jgi:maltooligosyltrehalose synthase
VPRLVLSGGAGDTAAALPPGTWRNAFTGEAADGADLFAGFPVALLERA